MNDKEQNKRIIRARYSWLELMHLMNITCYGKLQNEEH